MEHWALHEVGWMEIPLVDKKELLRAGSEVFYWVDYLGWTKLEMKEYCWVDELGL